MFMLMGGAEAVVAPTKPIVFQEDLTEAELNVAQQLPPGLENLGNTCYLNATIQAFRGVPELETALISGPFKDAGPLSSLAQHVGRLFQAMRIGGDAIAMRNMAMLLALRNVNPRYAETTNHGDHSHPVQQDAGECWGELMRAMTAALPGNGSASSLIDQVLHSYSSLSIYT